MWFLVTFGCRPFYCPSRQKIRYGTYNDTVSYLANQGQFRTLAYNTVRSQSTGLMQHSSTLVVQYCTIRTSFVELVVINIKHNTLSHPSTPTPSPILLSYYDTCPVRYCSCYYVLQITYQQLSNVSIYLVYPSKKINHAP